MVYRRIMDIQLYCAPTVHDREVWPATMRHIAIEGRCFVLSACPYSIAPAKKSLAIRSLPAGLYRAWHAIAASSRIMSMLIFFLTGACR
jgi:hypothetical protein